MFTGILCWFQTSILNTVYSSPHQPTNQYQHHYVTSLHTAQFPFALRVFI